jgi:REP element-mobilizing transposase RayT
MSTYTEILYQIVFGSKNCKSFLDEKNQEKLFNYIAGIVSAKKSVPYRIGGHRNHLHLIIYLHPTESLSNMVRDIKRASHLWMDEKKDDFKLFPGWQNGYGAFTYDYSSKIHLVQYVKNQKEHHKKISFQEELIELLKEQGIEFDDRYLFE